MMRKIFGNLRVLAVILALLLVVNIIFLCQPVFGTYTGVSDYTAYYGSGDDYLTKMTFNGGCVNITFTKGDRIETEAGVYQKVGDKIAMITFDTAAEHKVTTHERTCVRKSVFVLEYVIYSDAAGVNLISAYAVWMQIALGVAELAALMLILKQVVSKKETDASTDEKPSEDEKTA